MNQKLKKNEVINLSQIASQTKTFVIHIKWQQKNNKPIISTINLSALTLNKNNEINDIISVEQPVGEAQAILLKNQSFKIDLSKIPLSTKNIIFTLNSKLLNLNLLTITSTLFDFNSQQELAHYIIDDTTAENTLIALVLYRHQTQWHLKAIAQNDNLNIQTNHDNKIEDSDIIEVSESEIINYDNVNSNKVVVPFWAMQYIYSNTALNNATKEQTDFYFYFKEQFLNDNYIELGNNLNYAFVLLFDLIDEYSHHQYFNDLKKQLTLLGVFYPKTKPYCIRELEKLQQGYGYSRYDNYYARYNYNSNGLGNIYKERLQLNVEQVSALNQFNYQKNVFSEIEYCLTELILLYLRVIEQLETDYVAQNTTLTKHIELIGDLIARKEYRYRKGSKNYNACTLEMKAKLLLIIFKCCENELREKYEFNKPLSIDYYYKHPDINAELNDNFMLNVLRLIETQAANIKPLDETAELAINLVNKSRWKTKFKQLTDNFTVPKAWQFVEDIKKLARLNQGSVYVKTLFFDAYKFSVAFVKEPALVLYCYYSYHYDASPNKYKKLIKKEQKLLFSTSKQQQSFDAIISELLKTKNLETALQQISDFYTITRKTIQLNHQEISSIQQQHHHTVALLNTYLQDDNEQPVLETKPINENLVKTQTTVITSNQLGLNEVQFMLIKLFPEHDFSIEKSIIEKLVKEQGLFTSQVIDSINEACYDLIDDVLIEQEDDNYCINLKYYQRIIDLC
ncbi:MAG: tellurite resistance TerB C-terminal domain-containing protein [Methylococcaceae bacterium]